MKYCKKFMCFILAVSLLLSNVSVYASSHIKYEEEADVLYQLGLLKGYSSTDKQLGLEDPLTRQQAMKLIVEMMGWYVNDSQKSRFNDVANWAQPYVAVAYNKGITKGISDEDFGGKDQATMHQLVTWYLRALGYDKDVAWQDAAPLALQLNLVTATELVNFSDKIKRDELAGVAYKALSVEALGQDDTLLEQLVKEGIVDADDAIDLGFMREPEPEKIKILDVYPINLVQTKIEFNKAVNEESALDKRNYDIGSENVEDITLSQDKTVVIVTHTPVDNQDEIEVKIEDIKAEVGREKIEDYEEEIEYLDFDMPEIISIECIGERLFEIKLSEPIKEADKSSFKVKSVDNRNRIVINKITSTDSQTKLNDYTDTLHMYVYSRLKEGDYEVSIAGDVRDYAGYSVKPVKEIVTVYEDEEGPRCIDYEDVTATEVTLIFDEPLKVLNIDKKDVYHTNARKHASSVEVNGNKLKIVFPSDKPLPQGTAYVTVASDKLMDNWDNLAGTVIKQIERDVDKEGPVIEDIEVVDENSIKVTFSEAVDEKSAENKSNYTVIHEDGDEIDIRTIIHDEKTVTIIFKEDIKGEIEVIIDGVEDLYENECDDSQYVDIDDITSPKLLGAKLYDFNNKEWILRIRFNEYMATEGTYSVLDLEKYELNGDTLAMDDDISIDITDGGKEVEIAIPKDTSVNVRSGVNYLQILKVADEQGNTTAGLLVRYRGTNIDNIPVSDGNTEEIDYTIEAISDKEIRLVFEDELDRVNHTDFRIYAEEKTAPYTKKELKVASYDTDFDKDGNFIVGIELVDQLPSTDTTSFNFDVDNNSTLEQCKLIIDIPVSRESSTAYDEKVMAGPKDIEDKAAPAVKLDSDDEQIITVIKDLIDDGNGKSIQINIQLTEDIDSRVNKTLISNDLNIYVGGNELVYYDQYTIENDTNHDILKLKIPYDGTDDVIEELFKYPNRYRIDIELVDKPNYIKDTHNNVMEDLKVRVDLDDYEEVDNAPSIYRVTRIENEETLTRKRLNVEFSEPVTLSNGFLTPQIGNDQNGPFKSLDPSKYTLNVATTDNIVYEYTVDLINPLAPTEIVNLKLDHTKAVDMSGKQCNSWPFDWLIFDEVGPVPNGITSPVLNDQGEYEFQIEFPEEVHIYNENKFIQSVTGSSVTTVVKEAQVDENDNKKINVKIKIDGILETDHVTTIKLDYAHLADRFNDEGNNTVIGEVFKTITITEKAPKKIDDTSLELIKIPDAGNPYGIKATLHFDKPVIAAEDVIANITYRNETLLKDEDFHVIVSDSLNKTVTITINFTDRVDLINGRQFGISFDYSQVKDKNHNPSEALNETKVITYNQ